MDTTPNMRSTKKDLLLGGTFWQQDKGTCSYVCRNHVFEPIGKYYKDSIKYKLPFNAHHFPCLNIH